MLNGTTSPITTTKEKKMSIDHLFDVSVDNVHMVQVDSYEAATPAVPVSVAPLATKPQLDYLKVLFEQRSNNEEAMIIREHLLGEWRAKKLTVKMASEAIEEIKEIPRDVQKLTFPMPVEAKHGEVWVTSDGDFVRVKMNQAGTSLYGMLWDGNSWQYTPGILSKLDHIVTADEASQFGHEHQWCIFCSRPLSDPRSEYAGYGETCARKRDLPWGATAEDDAVINEPTTEKEDVYEYPYGEGSTCLICNQPRPYILNGYLRGCNC